jgi:hypothetical protein
VRESNVREGDTLLQGSDVVARLFTVAKDKHGIQVRSCMTAMLPLAGMTVLGLVISRVS